IHEIACCTEKVIMFCSNCGIEQSVKAQFCMQCGTRLQQVLALNPTGAPALTQQLPYNWGKFQGWISLVVGLFALLFAMASLVARAPLDDKAWGYGVLSPLLIATGYAI